MATVSLTTSPATLDSGASENVSVTNTGGMDVVVSRGAQSFTLRPTQGRVVYPEGAAVTAVTTSGSGQVTTVATAARASAATQFAADPAFTGTYARNDRGFYVPAGWGSWWKAARAAAGSSLARVAVVGDSITQGFHCSDLRTKSWPSLLRSSLQTAYGDGGSGYFTTGNTIPAFSTINTWPSNNYATVTGTWAVKGGTEGPGSTSIFNQNSAGSTVTFPEVKGSVIVVWYMTDPAFPGSFSVTIDGVAQGTQPSNAQAAAVRAQVYNVSAGTHTVVVTTIGATGLTCIFGVTGLNSSGVVLHNYGFNGRKSADFSLAAPTYGAPQSYSGGSGNPADLLIYALGVNDANTSVAVDTYLSNIRRHLDSVRGLGSMHGKVDVLFLMQHIGTFDASGTPLYHRYMQQIRGMAEAYGAAVVDMWARYYNNWDLAADSGYWGDGTSSGLAGTNTVHPSDAGHQAIANALLPILTAT